MNSKWLGDSLDLTKRVLLVAVAETGLNVFADPMQTDIDGSISNDYYKLIRANPNMPTGRIPSGSCLFLDPDTGISERKSKSHVTFSEIEGKCSLGYDLIIVFDQSFSRSKNKNELIINKLNKLKALGISGFYYDSHANFLFASSKPGILKNIKNKLREIGIPTTRLISNIIK